MIVDRDRHDGRAPRQCLWRWCGPAFESIFAARIHPQSIMGGRSEPEPFEILAGVARPGGRAAVTRDPPAQLAPRPNGARHSRTTLLHTLDTNSRRSCAMWHASGAMRCHRLHLVCPSVRPSVRARVALIARSLAGTTRHAHRRAQLEEKVKIKPKFVSWLAGDGVREPCDEVREGRQCVVHCGACSWV